MGVKGCAQKNAGCGWGTAPGEVWFLGMTPGEGVNYLGDSTLKDFLWRTSFGLQLFQDWEYVGRNRVPLLLRIDVTFKKDVPFAVSSVQCFVPVPDHESDVVIVGN